MKLDLPPTGGKFAILDYDVLVSGSDPHRYLLAKLLNDKSIRNISLTDILKLQKKFDEEYVGRLDLGALIPLFGNQFKIYGESSEFQYPVEADKPIIRAVTLSVFQAKYIKNTFTL